VLSMFIFLFAIVMSFFVDQIAVSQLAQSFGMILLVFTMATSGILRPLFNSDKSRILFMAFIGISSVSVASNASIVLFGHFAIGALVCFSAVLFGVLFIEDAATGIQQQE